MFNNVCGDCDNYDFDTNKCSETDEPKEKNDTCESFRNEKSGNYYYFGESN